MALRSWDESIVFMQCLILMSQTETPGPACILVSPELKWLQHSVCVVTFYTFTFKGRTGTDAIANKNLGF